MDRCQESVKTIIDDNCDEQGAVSTNGQECAKIGADVLARNGSAVDAAIAALLCEGVASLHRYAHVSFILYPLSRERGMGGWVVGRAGNRFSGGGRNRFDEI